MTRASPRFRCAPRAVVACMTAPEVMAAAWTKVRANKGGAGGDGQTSEQFAVRLDTRLAALAHDLRAGRYRPGPVRRYTIQKPDGRRRKLSVPSIRDRVAQTALLLAIGPDLDARMSTASFGYRPALGVADALARLRALLADSRPWRPTSTSSASSTACRIDDCSRTSRSGSTTRPFSR